MSFLRDIIAVKREEISRAKRLYPESSLAAETMTTRRDFAGALRQDGLAVIAEIKRASPSKGPLAPHLDPAQLVRRYDAGGAAAVSILTDRTFFGGSLEDLRIARQSTDLPLLRKDFILDPYQIVETCWAGADAILLIAACLGRDQLRELLAAAREYGLAALVETHNEAELELIAGLDPAAIGINNRDLATFQEDLRTTLRLLPLVPAGLPIVSESGIRGRSDAGVLARAGVDAILVGEALVKSKDPAEAIRRLRGAMTC